MTKNNKHFVDQFRAFVDGRKYTYDTLAKETGLGRSTFSHYYTGRISQTSTDFILRLVNFLRRDGHPNPEELIIAHLYDEAEQSGLETERLKIIVDKVKALPPTSIQSLAEAAKASEGWATVIDALAVLVEDDAKKGYPDGIRNMETLIVAEAKESGINPAQRAKIKRQIKRKLQEEENPA